MHCGEDTIAMAVASIIEETSEHREKRLRCGGAW
jgi:hypothetical protein